MGEDVFDAPAQAKSQLRKLARRKPEVAEVADRLKVRPSRQGCGNSLSLSRSRARLSFRHSVLSSASRHDTRRSRSCSVSAAPASKRPRVDAPQPKPMPQPKRMPQPKPKLMPREESLPTASLVRDPTIQQPRIQVSNDEFSSASEEFVSSSFANIRAKLAAMVSSKAPRELRVVGCAYEVRSRVHLLIANNYRQILKHQSLGDNNDRVMHITFK